MSKIIPIDLTYKNLKKFFSRTASKAEFAAAEKTGQTVEETAKVTSKQIEAYYKRYGKEVKIETPKPANNVPQQEKTSLIDKMVQKECDAYNKIRYIDVSKEALKDLEHNFEEKRKKVIDIIMANSQNLPKDYIHRVQQIKTPEHLSLIIRSYAGCAGNTLSAKYSEVLQQVAKKQKISLKTQQNLYKEEINISNTYVELVKAVTEPSKDTKVLQIENYIKTRYNMNYVHLDNIEDAERILKTIKIAIKNNIPLPKQIIVSPFTLFQTSGINIAHSFSERTIIMQRYKDIKEATEKAYEQFKIPVTQKLKQILKAQDAKWHSTDDELQTYLHEFCHSKYFLELLAPMQVKPVPVKYNKTAQNVGIYAISSRNELVTELKTKSILRSLNKDEKELLEYFE